MGVLMQPINYILPEVAGTGNVLQGYAAGLNFRGAEQQMAMNAAREARAQQLHPLAMEGAQLGMDAQRQNMTLARAAEGRNAQMFPYALAEQEQAMQVRDAQMQAQQAQMARQQEFQTALSGLGPTAGVADYQRVITQFPELSEGLADAVKDMTDQQRRGNAQVLGQASVALRAGNTDRATQLVGQYADALEGSGNAQDAALARGLVDTMRVDPDAAIAGIGVMLTHLDPEIAERALGAGGEAAAPNVREVRDFANGTSVTYFSDGTQVVRDAAGNVFEGQQAIDALNAANQYETELQGARAGDRRTASLEADIELGGQAEATKGLGRLQSDFVQNAFTQADQVAGSINNIQTAINALDQGARAGAIDRYLPNVTEASATLQNAMDRMGLDVIGSVTFGALSEAELRLAMETAVPRNLNEADLRNWLQNKLDAQRKVRAALLEQAQFLSNPQNTLEDWANLVRGGAPASGQAPAQPSYLEFGQ